MRKFLTLTCCLGLASLVGAAQNDDQNPKNKKGGGNAPQQKVVTSPTGKGGNPKSFGPHGQTFQQSNAVGGNKFKTNKTKFNNQSNLNSSANATTFNKSKNVNINKNVAANKNFKFQKKQFNLQTNNKTFIVNKYKTVNYNANYKIAGANKWKGAKYQVFVNYHPMWHDAWWYNSYHSHLVFIYGGWYYWDNSYWYPAWGYAPDSVYAFDGPIYGSSPAEDPGQVVANVQSALQEQGYYQGEVDGVLGPQTRAALAEYQSAQGLEPTGLVDEPTLETLGMS